MPTLYPRTISLFRPVAPQDGQGVLTPGLVGYAGLKPSEETARFSNIPASIQAEALGNTRNADIPAGSPGPVKWSIYIPKQALPKGSVKDQDIVVDDEGERYQVAFAYWNFRGYKLGTIRTSNAEA